MTASHWDLTCPQSHRPPLSTSHGICWESQPQPCLHQTFIAPHNPSHFTQCYANIPHLYWNLSLITGYSHVLQVYWLPKYVLCRKENFLFAFPLQKGTAGCKWLDKGLIDIYSSQAQTFHWNFPLTKTGGRLNLANSMMWEIRNKMCYPTSPQSVVCKLYGASCSKLPEH